MFNLVKEFIEGLTEEHGQTLFEYGLIMAVIAIAIVVIAAVTFGPMLLD